MPINSHRTPKTQNLTVRITPEDKTLIEQAAITAGEDLTTFLLSQALVRARDIVERATVTVLTGANRELFVQLMEKQPSERLLRNLRDDRHQIIE